MAPLKRLVLATRKFSSSAIRRAGDHHDDGGIPGANMPFKMDNRYRLTFSYMWFFASGFAIPFLALRHQLLKK